MDKIQIRFKGDVGWEMKKPVIRDLDLEITVGSLFCLLGPNGSGKTTLLLTLSKAIPPLKGYLEYSDSWIKPVYIPPYPPLAPTFSLGTVISYYLREQNSLLPSVDLDRLEMVLNMLRIAGVEYGLEREFRRLSTGEMQKTILFATLFSDRNALFLDEPNGHLDLKSRLILYHALRQASRKKIIVISLHDVNEASLNCERIVLLGKNNRVVAEGSVEECLTTENLETAYDTRFKSIVGGNGKIRLFVPYEEVQLSIRGL